MVMARDLAAFDRQPWADRANCLGTDPGLFFPERGALKRDVDKAKSICAGCDVADQCLRHALENHIVHGIWGGTTEKDRRSIKRARRARGEAA